MTAPITGLSPLDYAVISQALIAAAREMGVKLIRSAYSTILREARDGSAGLMDRFGNTVAQAELIRQKMETRDQKEVFLRGDSALQYQDLMEVFDALKAAGVQNVGMVAKMPGER